MTLFEQRKTYAAKGSIDTQNVAKNSGFEKVLQALVLNVWNVFDAMFDEMKSGRNTTSFSTARSRKRQNGLKSLWILLPVRRHR